MNIHEALKNKNIPPMFAEYFKYLHPDLRADQTRPLKTEEEFLKYVGRKSMIGFNRWTKSSQYKALIALYLDYRIGEDYEQIYEIVVANSKKGDPNAIKIFLSLQKDIKSNAKLAVKDLDTKYKVMNLDKAEEDESYELEDDDLDVN